MPDGRPRVLALTSTFPRWRGDATPRFVFDLSAGLVREGLDVTVLAPGAHGAAARERWDGVDIRRFRYGWPASTQRLADGAILPNIRRNRWLAAQAASFVTAELAAAWRLMRRERFDVIHAHWAVPQGCVAIVLKKQFRVPVLTTTHGADIYAMRGRPALAAKRWALRSSDAVTAVSQSLKDEVVALGVDAHRVHVLPMGVDTARFTPDAASDELRARLCPDGPMLLFVGRLAEKKGVRYAIEAMPAILREHPSARLIVVGDGPERDALLRLRGELGLGASVQFLGGTGNEELPAYYASADLLLAPSIVARDGDTESFGIVLVEAMASGCPVVASDVGGIREVVAGCEAAALVSPRDAAAIGEAACDVLRAATRRGAGVAMVRDRFDQDHISRSYAGIAERIAA